MVRIWLSHTPADPMVGPGGVGLSSTLPGDLSTCLIGLRARAKAAIHFPLGMSECALPRVCLADGQVESSRMGYSECRLRLIGVHACPRGLHKSNSRAPEDNILINISHPTERDDPTYFIRGQCVHVVALDHLPRSDQVVLLPCGGGGGRLSGTQLRTWRGLTREVPS